MESFLHNPVLFGEGSLEWLHLHWGPWFDLFMAMMTGLGTMPVAFILLCLLYWNISRERALKIMIILLLTAIFTDSIKYIYSNPRPDPEKLSEGLRQLNLKYAPSGPGFPSGHTSTAMALWGGLAFFFRKKPVLIACLMLIMLVPYSRLHLAVHFPGDVLGGYTLGLLALALLIPAIRLMEGHCRGLNETGLIILLFCATMLPLMILPGKHSGMNTGLISGLLFGALMARGRVDFNPESGLPFSLLKSLLGLAGIIMIHLVAGLLQVRGPASSYPLFWVTGFWITFMAPLLFVKMRRLKSRPHGGDIG